MFNSIRSRLLVAPPRRRSPPAPHGGGGGVVVVFSLLPRNPSPSPSPSPSPHKSLSSSSSSSSSAPATPRSETLAFLIDSCGLSPESAISAAQKLRRLRSTENPKAVVRLLRDYGFGGTHIPKIVGRLPTLLCSDPRCTLQPKLDFFRSFGFSGDSLARLLTSQPLLLRRSLADHLVPCFTFLRTLLPADGAIVAFGIRNPRGLNSDLNKAILPIIGVLRRHGLPEERISKLLMIQPGILILTPHRVNEIVGEVTAAGVPTSNPIFVYAFHTVAGLKRANWDRKMAAYKSFGLSEDDVVSLFRRHPMVMKMSEEKIRRVLEFFLGRLKLLPADILRHPILLRFGLEKRILPRCAVVSLLQRKGKLKENSSLISALSVSTSSFLKRYVVRHQDDLPEVLMAYNGEIEFKGLGID